MLVYLMLFLFIFYDSTVGDNSPSGPCCKTKIVGRISYTFKREDNTDGLNCLSDCVYERDDIPGSNFCFARGSLEVKCVNSNQTERFFESPCCNQKLVDGVLYDLHNSTANLTIARKDFCPSSCVYQVAKTNDTSDLFCFDAITNKHDSECFIPAKLNNLKIALENANEANSSLRERSAHHCAYLYELINYGGQGGFTQEADDNDMTDFWSNRVSSLKVKTGCKLRVYPGPNKSGSSFTFTKNTPWVGSLWNNKISSTFCTCGSGSRGDWEHCSSSFPCEDGKGDCDYDYGSDRDSQCQSGKCGINNCRDFHPNAEPWADCCINTGIQAEQDYVFSKNFQPSQLSQYPNNILGRHSISVPSGYHLYILFIEFHLEYANDCRYDSLKIIDNNGKPLFFGCGNWHDKSVPARNNFPSSIESNVGVQIIFKTDESETRKGFKLKVHVSGPSCSPTRSLVPDERAVDIDIDKHLAPHSYAARGRNGYLRKHVLSFDHIAPTLVLKGPGSSNTDPVIKWDDLKCSFEIKGNFNNKISTLRQFNRAKKLVIVAHGWKDGDINDCEHNWVSEMADLIRAKDPETATIAVCWNSIPKPPWPFSNNRGVGKLCEFSYKLRKSAYYSIAASTAKVGEFLAEIVTSVQAEFPDIKYTHGIGHSLGAHVMGNIFNFGGLKLNRISGMDPAGPCFEGSSGDINNMDETWTGQCVVDSRDRLLPHYKNMGEANTPKFCIEYCATNGFDFAGVQYAHECWCGDLAPPRSSFAPEEQCKTPCTGDKSQICGAGWRMNVYTAVLWTGQCVVDSGDRLFPHLKDMGEANTPNLCIEYCTTKGFALAGVQYARECWCGYLAPPRSSFAPDGECNQPCSGSASHICGAGWRMNVYALYVLGRVVWGLSAASADFVDNIHTDGAHYGTYQTKGHIDFFAGQVDSVGSQPSCRYGCLAGCCHTKAIEYYNASITHKEKFLTAYPTKTQDNYVHPSSIQIASDPEQELMIKAGYYASSAITRRMYLPIFEHKHSFSTWASMCDLENLSTRDAAYCCKCCSHKLPASVSALCPTGRSFNETANLNKV